MTGCSILAAVLTLAIVLARPADAAPPDAHCVCRAPDGSKHEVGQTACLHDGAQSVMAQCRRDGDVARWLRLEQGCPQVRVTPTALRSG